MDKMTNENNFLMECLKSAVSYCKEQYETSGVDWLPSVNFINLQDEAAKFYLLEDYLRKIDENIHKYNVYDHINHSTSDEDCRMLMEVELVKTLLNHCYTTHGAKVKIVVEHDDGHVATANLYDHAALIEPLMLALINFQQELV